MKSLIALLIVGLPAMATPITNAGISGIGTTNVSASATAFYFGGCFLCPADPFSISADASASLTTLGPVRAGFIEIFGFGGGEFGSGSGSVGGYSFGCSFACSPGNYLNGTPLPFTLGVPFQVNVSAIAGFPASGGNGRMDFNFLLFESLEPSLEGFHTQPGVSVTVFEVSDLPEPATFAPVAMGLLGLIWAKRRSFGLRVN